MSNYLELVDLAAVVTIHIGNYYKVNKKSKGWLFPMVAISWFITRAITTGFVAQSLGHALSLILSIYGFWKWRKND